MNKSQSELKWALHNCTYINLIDGIYSK